MPKRTPFHALHAAAGAKLIDFSGFEMPVRYTGDVREHTAVRERAGLFDISHMGEFFVSGEGAAAYLDSLVTNDVGGLAVGQALYSPMCRPDGGIVDDLLVYRTSIDYMVVVNASNRAKDWEWMHSHCPPGVRLEDRSEETALLAVQGPKSPDVLRGHVPDAMLDLGYYRVGEGTVFGADALIARTGYTGEDGFELYFPTRDAETVWNGLMEAGRGVGMEPIGLGARDTLRLEMGFMLYGNDIDDTTSPLEAGLRWTVKFAKPEFNGRAVLAAQKEHGPSRKLVAFELDGRRMPRHDMPIEAGGRVVGRVTSGSFGPSIHKPIGMGYVETAFATPGGALDIVAGSSKLPARIVKLPFYKRGSRKTG